MSDEPPSVLRAKEQIKRVIAVLRRDGSAWTDRLQSHLDEMNGWYATTEALFAVGVMCHPKCLGDHASSAVSSSQWEQTIRALEHACADAFNDLERRGPTEPPPPPHPDRPRSG